MVQNEMTKMKRVNKNISLGLFVLFMLSPVCLAFSDPPLLFPEREAILERVENLLYVERDVLKEGYFGGGLYVDRNRVVFMHTILSYDEENRVISTRYVERYDLLTDKLERMVPYVFIQTVPFPNGRTLDIPHQMALFEKDGALVLVRMNYLKGTWRELAPWPSATIPFDVQQVPNTNRFAYSIPLNRLDVNNPDCFALHVFDWRRGTDWEILSEITHQNILISSMGSCLPYVCLDNKTLLYAETINPYFFDEEKHNFYQQFPDEPTYDALWRLNLISGEKIEMATHPVAMSSKIVLDGDRILWNREDMGSRSEMIGFEK